MAEVQWREQFLSAQSRGERLIDLALVDAWLHKQKDIWEDQGLTVVVHPATQALPKNSVRADIDGSSFVSTLIIWDSGEWDVTVGLVEGEGTETSDYQPATSTEEVISKVRVELQRKGIIS